MRKETENDIVFDVVLKQIRACLESYFAYQNNQYNRAFIDVNIHEAMKSLLDQNMITELLVSYFKYNDMSEEDVLCVYFKPAAKNAGFFRISISIGRSSSESIRVDIRKTDTHDVLEWDYDSSAPVFNDSDEYPKYN